MKIVIYFTSLGSTFHKGVFRSQTKRLTEFEMNLSLSSSFTDGIKRYSTFFSTNI